MNSRERFGRAMKKIDRVTAAPKPRVPYEPKPEDAAAEIAADRERPHEYVGQAVHISVGEVWEPCHLCGQEHYQEIHNAHAVRTTETNEVTPF